MIDYKDISNHSISSIRDNIAYMSQDIVLFNHTIKSNIAYSRDGLVEDAEIYEAAKLAQIHDVILEMPDGYDTIIGERGAMLSLGERQRIALARVLLKKPKILIFDEITASLDLYNKERVEDTIKSLRNKYTIIIISHNLSFMSELDQIILIDKGKVVTAGTHNNLAKSKLYKSLYRGGEPC